MRKCLAALATLALAAPTLAAEEHRGETNIFNADIGNFVFTLIIFGLVILILGRFAWRPVLTILHERERTIREALEAAQRGRGDAERLLAEYRAQLERARADASAIVEEGRRDAEAVRRRMQEEARREADALVERARREIQLATAAAIKDVYDHAADLSLRVAERVLGQKLSAEDHRQLVQESLREMQAVDKARLN